MPTQQALARARRDKRQGKAPTTQAGEFIREEMDEYKAGNKKVKSKKQAIAIGLSEARRAGVKLPPNPNAPKKSARKKASKRTRH